MTHDEETERGEREALNRTRCAVSAAVAHLKVLGLYQMAPDCAAQLRPVDLDPRQRRELLVFLTELEDLVGVLESFKRDLAQNIEIANRSLNAVSAYRRTGATLKQNARKH